MTTTGSPTGKRFIVLGLTVSLILAMSSSPWQWHGSSVGFALFSLVAWTATVGTGVYTGRWLASKTSLVHRAFRGLNLFGVICSAVVFWIAGTTFLLAIQG